MTFYEFNNLKMTHYAISSAMKARLASSLVKSTHQAESRKFARPSTEREIDPRGSILLIHKRIATTASARQEIDKYRRM